MRCRGAKAIELLYSPRVILEMSLHSSVMFHPEAFLTSALEAKPDMTLKLARVSITLS